MTLELRLVISGTERLLLQHEFSAEVAMTDETPLSAVLALSLGTGRVLADFLDHCQRTGVFAGMAKPVR